MVAIEALEGRALMSTIRAAAAPRPAPPTQFLVTPSSQVVTRQQGAFTVDLTLKQGAGGNGDRRRNAVLDHPLTVDFVASTSPRGNEPNPTPGLAFQDYRQTVTLPAGVSTATVTVPVAPAATGGGASQVYVQATPSVPAAGDPESGSNSVWLFDSPDDIPPKITQVRTVTQGRLASAVVVTFSKPMAAATVEDPANFRVLSRPSTSSQSGFLFWKGSTTTVIQAFPLASARYDPATNSVTLTLKRRAPEKSLYEVASAYPMQGRVVTDTAGRPVDQDPVAWGLNSGTGAFTVLVHPVAGVTPRIVGTLRTTQKTDSPISQLNPMRGFS